MKPKPRNKPPFLQQKTTGRVFPYTVELEQYRTDMVPFWGTQEEANAANERIRLDRARKRNAAAVGMGITQPVVQPVVGQDAKQEMSPPFADLLPAGALGPPEVIPPLSSKGGLLSSVTSGVEPTTQGDIQEEVEPSQATISTDTTAEHATAKRGMEYLKTIEGDMSKLREYGRENFNVKFPPSTTMDVIFKELVLMEAAGPMETIELDGPVDPQE